MQKKPTHLILHIQTNNGRSTTSTKILNKIFKFKNMVIERSNMMTPRPSLVRNTFISLGVPPRFPHATVSFPHIPPYDFQLGSSMIPL